jgi:N4-gp56 family major capsid protein
MKDLKWFDIQLFANPNTNTTNDGAASGDTHTVQPTMKTFYKTSLLENARNEHYFNQFGQKQPLPKNGGKKVEWRKFDTYAKATTPLTEGVTPDGNFVNMTKIEKEISQFGDYTTISDRLELEAVDPVIAAITEEHGAQAGDTLNIITRNEVVSGTNVIYAGGKTSRGTLTASDTITPTLVDQAFTFLKKMKAPTINGDYIGIIHPSVAYDLRESADWLDVHKYAQPGEIYNGEIGKLHGVRFIEDTEQKIWAAGASNVAVYATTIFGKDAYGIIEPSAESLEVIIKQRGSAGTADPLDQRSTVGWKASHAAQILYQERLVRIESGSFYSGTDAAN